MPASPKSRVRVFTLARLRKEIQPCAEAYEQIRALYPRGVPCTTQAVLGLHERGVDVRWGMLRLLTDAERVAFLLFTLRQRQPHVISMLRDAALAEHADAVAALGFDTPEQALAAAPVLDAASGDAARAASGDAARAASRDAALAASGDASRNAARNAAGSALWAASRNAGRNAAGVTIREQIIWLAERILARAAAGSEGDIATSDQQA